jgi:HSP20 family molecular chaperone IbpA
MPMGRAKSSAIVLISKRKESTAAAKEVRTKKRREREIEEVIELPQFVRKLASDGKEAF